MKNTMALAVAIFLAPVVLFADTVYLECEVEIVERTEMADTIEGLLGDTSVFTVSLHEGAGSVSHVYTTASNFKDFRESGVFSPSSVAYSRSLRLDRRMSIQQDFTIDRSDLRIQVTAVVDTGGFPLGGYVQRGECEILDVGKTRKF